MKRRLTAWFLATFLCLSMSVPSFASVATSSDAVNEVDENECINSLPEISDFDSNLLELDAAASSVPDSVHDESPEDDLFDSRLAVDDVSGSVINRVPVLATPAQLMSMAPANNGIVLYSSLGSVTNTIDRTAVTIRVWYNDNANYVNTYMDSSGKIKSVTTPGPISRVQFILHSLALPPTGTYSFGFDYSSDFSYDAARIYFSSNRSIANANTESLWSSQVPFTELSGDVYISDYVVELRNSYDFNLLIYVNDTDLYNWGGSARFNFALSSDTPSYSGVGTGAAGTAAAEEAYQQEVSSSLGSIGDTLEEIVETISLQLEALWNQMYNLIHIPELNKLEEIRQAIENIRLDVDVDNTAVVNKIEEQKQNDNANTNKVTNGYDKSSADSSNTQLQDTFDKQDDQEQQIFEQIQGPLEEFEFKNPITQYLSTFLLFGNFLQDLFTSSGGMADVINLSFVITIALMVVGLYRFKGGN